MNSIGLKHELMPEEMSAVIEPLLPGEPAKPKGGPPWVN
jgi:hypothetical protein